MFPTFAPLQAALSIFIFTLEVGKSGQRRATHPANGGTLRLKAVIETVPQKIGALSSSRS
jgi:hypothetical protein